MISKSKLFIAVLTAFLIFAAAGLTACKGKPTPAPAYTFKPGELPSENASSETYEVNHSNLANGGFVAENESYIIYKNIKDGAALYKINKKDNASVKMASTFNSILKAINIYDGKVYFIAATEADSTPGIYVIGLDGSGYKKLADNVSNDLFVDGGYAYYTTMPNNNIYRYDLATGEVKLLVEKNASSLAIADDTLFYIESTGGKSIYEYSLITNENKPITEHLATTAREQRAIDIRSLQYYDGSLYWIYNLTVTKFNLTTRMFETVVVNPSMINAYVNALHVSHRGIYFSSSDSGTNFLFNYETKAVQICTFAKVSQAQTRINLGEKYIYLLNDFDGKRGGILKAVDVKGSDVDAGLAAY